MSVQNREPIKLKVTPAESVELIKRYPELVLKSFRQYRDVVDATTKMMSSMAPVSLIWATESLSTPLIGHLIHEFTNLQRTGVVRETEEEREKKISRKYEVFSAIQELATKEKDQDVATEPVHLYRERRTGDLVVVKADVVAAQCSAYEPTRPGFTDFVGDLFTMFDFTGSVLAVQGTATAFAQAAPAPYYNWSSLVGWASLNSAAFFIPSEGQSSRARMLQHIPVLGNMEMLQYLRLQDSFYKSALSLPAVLKRGSITSGVPIDQVGKALVSGKKFFSTVTVPQGERNNLVYRTGPWQVSVPTPTKVHDSLSGLSNTRVWRREGTKGLSGLTRGHASGGDFSDQRIQVTRVLALAMPKLRESGEIFIRVDSSDAVSLIHKELILDQVHHKGTYKFIMTKEEAMSRLGPDYLKFYAEVRTSGKLLIDMVSSQLPAFPSKCNIDQIWEDQFNALLPSEPYIARRKVPPSVVAKHPVYVMGSFHAFDGIVTSLGSLEYMGRKIVLAPDRSLKSDCLETIKPDKLATLKEYLQRQHRDDRRKLCFFQQGMKVEPSSIINLWVPFHEFSKKDKRVMMTTIAAAGDAVDLENFDSDEEEGQEVENFDDEEDPVAARQADQEAPDQPADGGAVRATEATQLNVGDSDSDE